MLPQSPVINVILGALLSGILLIINTSVNNRFQLKREKEQRIWQKESERQKWYREKVYDCYIRTIQILTKVFHEHHEAHMNSIANVDNTSRLNKETSLTNSIIEFYS